MSRNAVKCFFTCARCIILICFAQRLYIFLYVGVKVFSCEISVLYEISYDKIYLLSILQLLITFKIIYNLQIPSIFPEQTGELLLHDNFLTRLNLSSTVLRKLKTLNLERNHFDSLNFVLPQSVTTVKLAGNKLTRFFNKPPSKIFTWTLAENPWICDCDTRMFKTWILQKNNNVSKLNDRIFFSFNKNNNNKKN